MSDGPDAKVREYNEAVKRLEENADLIVTTLASSIHDCFPSLERDRLERQLRTVLLLGRVLQTGRPITLKQINDPVDCLLCFICVHPALPPLASRRLWLGTTNIPLDVPASFHRQ